MNQRILLVDDDTNILEQIRLELERDYTVFTAALERAALRIFEKEKPAVVMLDLALNRGDPSDLAGMRLLDQMISTEPMTRAIMVSGNRDEEHAFHAIRLGAFDYYIKPVVFEELKISIKRAFHIHHLHERMRRSTENSGFDGVVGFSQSMKTIFRFVKRLSETDVSLLICGESGTGKEVLAQTIHAQSNRKNNPFIVVNCRAIPESLLESELFGHEKGALTGAHAQKRGKLELAHTGTLFLDEIGELAPPLQVKLLRFLRDRRIERVGGIQATEIDVRVIAATNRDLNKDIENGRFREDLYYRLKGVPLEIPALRERKEDIIPLAQHFLKKFCREHRKPPMALSLEAEQVLLKHPWPGNVRELENLINRSVVLSFRTVLKASDLGLAPDQIRTDVNLKFAKRAIEMDFVKKALQRHSGIVSRAARELGISRVSLYDLLGKYNIRPEEFKITRPLTKTHIKMQEVS